MPKAILVIDGFGEHQARYIIDALQAVLRAYNNILAFHRVVGRAVAQGGRRRIIQTEKGPVFESVPMVLDVPSDEEVVRLIFPDEHLILRAAQISSPGYWKFEGVSSVLEVIRQWMCDHHERKKDKDYRNRADEERSSLENELLKYKVIQERVKILTDLGAHEADLAPLIDQLIYSPLSGITVCQDRGLLGAAQIEPDEDQTEQPGRKLDLG
jgi:hypothetical protein